MGDRFQKGQCWQFEDDEDTCLWVDGIDVDGVHVYMSDNNGKIFKWSRESLLECADEVEDD